MWRLHLEDKSYKAEPERQDASPILSFLATGKFSDVKQKTPSARMAFPRLTSLSLSSVSEISEFVRAHYVAEISSLYTKFPKL